jgi:Protein of unknown function (DUF3800)
MYIAYFDEVKPSPRDGHHNYTVGGIVVKMADIAEIEAELTKLSSEVFGSTELVQKTEFHGTFIYHGKGAFKGMSIGSRLEIFRRLGAIINLREKIKLVYASINTEKLFSSINAAEHAFMHFVERVQMAIEADTFAILIGDLDDEQARNMVSEFSRYRSDGTNSAYGVKIRRIVDSVHFCRSHHSRMIQLADVYLFLSSGRHRKRVGYVAESLTKIVSEIDLFPTRYKEWPQ